jgi:two-component system LytT family response regulator
VNKAVAKHEKNAVSQTLIVNLLNNVDEDETRRTIAFHKSDAVNLVKVTDISQISGESNYSRIKTSSDEEFLSSKTLKEFEEYLSRFSFFIRIHKNCMINAHHIKQYSNAEWGRTGNFQAEKAGGAKHS